MFENSTTALKLGEKIEKLILKYHELELENEKLRTELTSSQAASAAKDVQISKLEDELRVKTKETDELLGKIEAVLGI
ncbi:MAG: hypothetical protein ACK5LP_04150 [Campylobacteraceae bacterium]